MKKILAAVILLVYFTVSTGFAVSVHYCMDQFESAQLGASHDDVCNKCGMDTGENNCCRDEVQVLKLQTSHVNAPSLQLSFNLLQLPVIPSDFILTPTRNFESTTWSDSQSPPIGNQDIHIEYCVFRI